MNQNTIRIIAILFICLCFTGCALLHRNNDQKPLQTGESSEYSQQENMELYAKGTDESIAQTWYDKGYALVRFEMDIETKRANAPKAIEYFQKVIDEVPNTDYADLSYVQLGLCYEYLGKWDEAQKAYEKLIKKYTDKNGYFIEPFSENIEQAVRFAQDRLKKLKLMLIA